ncbi:DNA cytosine methyltransferase [Antarcticirhabdus aurantiaca]|uniref:DNA cytosine methyltransferase n=1 Tax=Antarcticirhabdus aurantiaca TaxID=2606717 RepID=A0ACD4NNZ7_9HYPH|nr:DNA cytosine methyltransferase [Antarcticirhabdus aurantiaca]WAJ28508.1 DNA cytosine methyltransferase [Jeongeuplla avenae]
MPVSDPTMQIENLRGVWAGASRMGRPLIGVDLFAGAGGLSLGALAAGVQVVGAVEMHRWACATYRSNLIDNRLTRTKLFETDILELDPARLMRETGLDEGRCDILLGGPPCQGFSSHRLNDAGVGDPRNRLLLRYFEFVAALRPRIFLVENVPGMLWPRHRWFLEEFYRLTEESGYHLPMPFSLNARDYGVPQNRRRVFLLGTDRTQDPVAWPPEPTCSEGGLIAGTRPWPPASVVFDEPVDASDENGVHMRHGEELTAAFAKTPINGGSRKQSGRTLRCHGEHDGHSDVYGRINPDLPGPTMTTACINPSKGRFVHPTEPHGITLRHAARFQTFPEWFVFKGGLTAGGSQIGNAVPVKMARTLVLPLVELLQDARRDRRPAAA